MRSVLVALTVMIAILVSGLGRAYSAPSVAGALGSGATLVSAKHLPETAGCMVVTFQRAGWHVGLVVKASNKFSLVWQRELRGDPLEPDVRGGGGLFRLETRFPGSHRERLYAYRATGSHVSSAIAHVADGYVTAGEGIILHADGFTLRNPDLHHVGSVKYRTAILYRRNGLSFGEAAKVHEPDYRQNSYPIPGAWVKTTHGDTVLLRLEIADTDQLRATGLMNRKTLDADSGMIFTWNQPIDASFWMENTVIPLSIAFIGLDGTIQELQDMQPQTTEVHTPRDSYWYAIEANAGFFARSGIKPGDQFHLRLTP